MRITNFITDIFEDSKIVLSRFKSKDYSGSGGRVIKNTSYSIVTSLIIRFGSLIFTLMIMKALDPEHFGYYTLALSTILIFSYLSGLGIGNATTTLISKALGNNRPGKAKAYFKEMAKYRIYLTIAAMIILAATAGFLANVYYDKPIFYALLAGVLYLPLLGFHSHLAGALQANNNFRYPMIKESIFNVFRIIIIPLPMFFLFGYFSSSIIVLLVILGIETCSLLSLIYLIVKSPKDLAYLKSKTSPLTKKEKKDLRKFLYPLSAVALSGIFFSYIDTLMLGHFVSGTFIGYYAAALTIVFAASSLVGAIPGALLPVISRQKGEELERTFRKIRNVTLAVSTLGALALFFLAEYILLIFKQEYMPSLIIIRIFALFVILLPLSGLHDAYLTSVKRSGILAKLLIFSTILNVILNWVFIVQGLQYGMMGALIGASVATIISKVIYLAGLIYVKNR